MYKTQQKTTRFHLKSVVLRVEVAGFEPAAFWSRTKRATKLRYTSVIVGPSPTHFRPIPARSSRIDQKMLEPIRGLEPLTY